jgi:hypothetical protein
VPPRDRAAVAITLEARSIPYSSPRGRSRLPHLAASRYNPACGLRAGVVQVFEPVLRLAMRPVVTPCGLCYSGHGSGDTPLIEQALRSVGGVQK